MSTNVIESGEASEKWEVINDAPNYLISDIGRVKSIKREMPHSRNKLKSCIKKEKIMTPVNDGRGYLFICLVVDGKRIFRKVHRLVAEAFIPNIEGKPHINHKNAVKTDNRANNLEWVTPLENYKHAYRMGLTSLPDNKGEKSSRAKLNEMQVRLIRRLAEYNLTHQEISEYFPVKRASITYIINRRNWSHI